MLGLGFGQRRRKGACLLSARTEQQANKEMVETRTHGQSSKPDKNKIKKQDVRTAGELGALPLGDVRLRVAAEAAGDELSSMGYGVGVGSAVVRHPGVQRRRSGAAGNTKQNTNSHACMHSSEH